MYVLVMIEIRGEHIFNEEVDYHDVPMSHRAWSTSVCFVHRYAMNHYENVNALAVNDWQTDAKDEKMFESVCFARCTSDEMSSCDKVSVTTIDDAEAKPKIEKMEQDKLTESVFPVPSATDEMKISWDNTSVFATEGGPAGMTAEETDKNVKNYYIRQRYHRKYLKCAFTTIGIIIIVVFIALLAMPFKRDSNTKLSGTPTDVRGKLVVLNDKNQLLTFDPKTENSTVIFSTTDMAGAFDVHIEQRIYWLEETNFPFPQRSQLKAHVNGSTRVLMNEKRFNPVAMALDHFSENIYVIDEVLGNLVVVSTRTGKYALLVSRFQWPEDIVLDPEEGLMFILDRTPDWIIRATMDGTEITTVVSNGISSLTLDPKRKRLYWIGGDYAKMKSSDYDGNHRQTFFNGASTMYDLAVLDDRLYWLRSDNVHPPNLFSCEISADNTCEKYTNYSTMNFGYPRYVRGYSSTHGMFVKNPCGLDNGGCQQLCLLAGNNTRSCACRMGWQVNPDERSCSEACNFLIYTCYGLVRVSSINGAAKDLIWPIPYKIESVEVKGEIDFDYDMKNDDFYWSDDTHIYKMKLKKYDGNSTIILSVNEPNTTLQDIAYDWHTGNLYFIQRHPERHTLMMFNVNLGERHRKTLMTYYYKKASTLHACPYALRLDPARNSIFYACWGFIQAATMNNTSTAQIHSSFPEFKREYRLVAVDYAKDRLYWIWHSDLVTIVKHSKFDGSDVRVVSVNGVRNGRMIDVHERWLYIGNSTDIWRVDKERGGDAVKIPLNVAGRGSFGGFKVVSEKVHASGDGNHCAEGNGGCQQFCLSGEDGPVCMCEDNIIARGFTCSRD